MDRASIRRPLVRAAAARLACSPRRAPRACSFRRLGDGDERVDGRASGPGMATEGRRGFAGRAWGTETDAAVIAGALGLVMAMGESRVRIEKGHTAIALTSWEKRKVPAWRQLQN